MRLFSSILIVIALVLSFGCSTNPQAIPAAVAAATVLVIAIEPEVCSDVPWDQIDDAIVSFESSYVVAKATCDVAMPIED